MTGNITNNGNANKTIASNITVSGTAGLTASINGTLSLNDNLSGGSASVFNTGGSGSGTKSYQFGGNNSGFTGTFNNTTSSLVRTRFTAGSAAAIWNLDSTATNGAMSLSFGDGTISFGTLSGNGRLRQEVAGTSTVSVGARDEDSTFSGILQQSSGATILALTKVGTGTMTLSGANTYTGATQVTAGKLVVNGSIGNSAVTVSGSGNTLATDVAASFHPEGVETTWNLGWRGIGSTDF